MAKPKTVYICENCGYKSSKWLGRCSSCGEFDTFSLATETKNTLTKSIDVNGPRRLNEIDGTSEFRMATDIRELDRVLSGGLVKGSLTLVGGDPGIGKSTLLLQLCEKIGTKGKKILYTSGEESQSQIKLRANRLDITTENLYLLSETNMTNVINITNETKPDFLIIDSIQTIYKEDIASSPGSITQTRECVTSLMKLAKNHGITVIIVGHVTKEGALAGPKVLEHMVDTVIYFEGDRYASYRIIRSIKNRFGSTNEIGVFEMKEKGLCEIENPSEYMLSGRPSGVSGSVITCSVEGTRPILTEVQSLVSYTNFGQPRRTATGMDYNRVVMLLAVLEKRCNMDFSSFDAYVNIAGGLRILEPSLDTAVIAALASSYKNIPMDHNTIIFGEVGLAGEIRGITHAQKRIQEAKKLGFKRCIMPKTNLSHGEKNIDIEVLGVTNIKELLFHIGC